MNLDIVKAHTIKENANCLLRYFMQRLIPNVGSLVILIAMLMTWHSVEGHLMPVVERFKITSITYSDTKDNVRIEGTMEKVRDCNYIGLSVNALYENTAVLKRPVKYEFLDLGIRDRSNGSQQWGPWEITLPVNPRASHIEVEAIYSCHVFWNTRTTLTKFLIV